MIAKGNQRAGGQNLATHLMNGLDNERVDIADVRGAVARDLHGAFLEWFAASKATKCRKYLYSLSISPDQQQGKLTRAQYLDFIARTEKKLKLQDNSRVVVFHVKDGREHCHVVWSRIDTDRMKAVQISHDRQKLRLLVRAFARDHGLELPAGLKRDKGTERFNDHARQSNLTEKQQEERSGITTEERRNDVAAAWRDSRTGPEFIQKLQDRGYYIARGDQRGYVIIDQFGEVHSLSKQLTPDVKSREMKARLIDFPADKLPSIDTARDYARQWRDDRLKHIQKQIDPEQLRADLAHEHSKRRAVLDGKRHELEEKHKSERRTLERDQRRREQEVAQKRKDREPKGLLAFLGKITGVNALRARGHARQDRQRSEAHGAELDALDRRHERELKEFGRHGRALTRVEKREAHSLKTAIRREQFQSVLHPAPAREMSEKDRAPAREVGAKATEIKKDFNLTSGIERQRQEKQKEKSRPPKITDIFRENAAQPAPDHGSVLNRHFREAGKPPKEKPANDPQQEQPRRRRDRDTGLER